MAIEQELATLQAVTANCTLQGLDSSHGTGSAVLTFPGGTTLRVSSSAAALIKFARHGDPPETIADRFGAEDSELEAAVVRLTRRILDAADAGGRRKPGGFLAQRRLVSGARVAAWVQPLGPAFSPGLVSVLVVASLVTLASVASDVAAAPRSPFALWCGYAIGLALMFIHELGHAAACRRLGANVGDIGCAIYLIYPALFCDVTSTWTLKRSARVVVDLGGLYFQLVATSVLALIWLWSGSAAIASAIRISGTTMVLNLMPLGRFDGYWVLSDVLGVIDLRGQHRVLVDAVWARLRGRRLQLPWSWWTTAAISVYALATAWFFASIARSLLPQVVREVSLLPARLRDLADDAAAADGFAVLAAIGRLVSSGIIVWVAFALTRNSLRVLRRWASRWRPPAEASARPPRSHAADRT